MGWDGDMEWGCVNISCKNLTELGIRCESSQSLGWGRKTQYCQSGVGQARRGGMGRCSPRPGALSSLGQPHARLPGGLQSIPQAIPHPITCGEGTWWPRVAAVSF